MGNLPVINAATVTEIIDCQADPNLVGKIELIVEHLGGGKKKCSLAGTPYSYKTSVPAYTSKLIGTIPEGYRPVKRVPGVLIANYAAGYAYIEPDGKVTFYPNAQVKANQEISPVFPPYII